MSKVKDKKPKAKIEKAVVLTSQQAYFLSLYTNPESPHFGNAYKAALTAGYSEDYAKVICSPNRDLTWLSENVRDLSRLQEAEKVLDETLRVPHVVQAMGAFGPIWKDKEKTIPVMVTHVGALKVKADVAKFVAETVGKRKYSKKIEVDVVSITRDDFKDYE